MKLIFIRHGDPDYVHDSLTEKGFREAEILSSRIEKLNVKDFYCSPLGRAKDTARPTLKKMNRDAKILDWLMEFPVTITDPNTGKQRIPWNFMPAYWTNQPELYDKNNWATNEVLQTGKVLEEYNRINENFDLLLQSYGYERENNLYRVKKANEDTLVFFCHLGVQFVILSHLLGISPSVMWHSFFVAPASVTIIESEERCQGEAYFRCKTIGDTSHFYAVGEPPSNAGFFQETWMP